MDLTRPSSGHDQAEDPIKIHHPEEEEHHESRASKMFGKVKARAKKFKNSLTKHGNEHSHDVVDEEEEEDENDEPEPEPEKHVAPVNEVSAVRSYRTSQPESLSHPRETSVPAPEEIVPSGTKDSTAVYSSDDTRRVEPDQPLRDATYEHETPSYPVRTSDVSDREDSRETYHVPLNTPVSQFSATEDVTTPGEDEFLGGQREVNTERPKRLEDDLSGESTYRSKIPYHTQQGSGEAGEDESHYFDQKIESGTKLMEDFLAKSHEFEQTIGSGIGKDTGGGKPGTERREDFLGKSYEFDQEIESAIGKDSPSRLGGESGLDENFPARSDDMKVETGLTGTNDHFSPEFSGPKERDDFDSQAEQTRYEAQEPKPTTYTERIGSATSFMTDKAIATKNAVASSLGYSGETAGGKHESPVGVETVAEKLTTDDENVKETASPVTTKLPLFGGGNGAEETEQGEDKGVSTRDHLAEKLTPEEEDKAFSDMVAEKLNLGGGGEKKTTTTKEVEVAVEKIPSDKLPEEIEHGEAVAEEMKGGGGGMVGKIKGAYNYWLGGTTEEVKPKSPVSVEESPQSLGSTVGTKGFSDSGESGLGETGSSTGAVPVQREL